VLSNKSPLVVIRSLTKEYLFNHFSLLIIAFKSFSTDMLINILILERFTDNILSKFTYLGERGGKEATSFPKKG
jgi:hypothetical protein